MHHTIDIVDLSYSYPDGRQALDGVTLHIEPGQRVALVGPNGAGKSTLLLHLNGTLRGAGEIRVCGVPIREETLPTIRSSVGLVFHDPDDQLFSPTVDEDVAFGPLYMGLAQEEIERRVEAALRAVGMNGAGSRPPFQLSMGEKKRVALATVLAMDPEILALDEPTAELDPRGKRQLMALLQTLSQTMLVATHDMQLVRDFFPRTVIINAGRIVADGPTTGVLADGALLLENGLA